MAYLLIDPDEKLDYVFDWAAWLKGSDTISVSTWTVSPDELTLSGLDKTDTTATVFVNGATLGEIYTLTNRIVTVAGLTAERTVSLRCEAR